jgi:hypothetical protein
MSTDTSQLANAIVAALLLVITSGTAAAAATVPPPRPSTAATIAAHAETVATWSGNAGDAISTVTETATGVAEVVEHNASNAAARARALASMSHNPVTQTGYATMAQHTFQQGMARADGIRDALAMPERVGTAASMVSYAATGTQIVGQVVDGNYNDAAITSGQLAAEEVVSRGGAHMANALCGPPCAATYGAGNAAGSLIKQIDTCAFRDCGPGKSYTIEDAVTDRYYDVYEKVSFRLDPSKDPMSDEFAAKVQAQIAQNKRNYQQRSTDLRSQQELLDQKRAAAAASAAPMSTPGSSSSEGSGFTDFFSTLVDGALEYQQLQSTYDQSAQGSAGGASSSADPGGCHSGHDEQAHPGGCLSAPLN